MNLFVSRPFIAPFNFFHHFSATLKWPGRRDTYRMMSRFRQRCDAINNELHVLINHAYALKGAAKAHIDLEGRATTGAAILRP